jgi:glutamyl endopeptidase
LHSNPTRARRLAIAVGLTLLVPATAGAGTAMAQKQVSSVSSSGKTLPLGAAGTGASARPYAGTGITSPKRPTASDPAFATPAGGGSESETVIAPDRRLQITATTAYPARATVHITFKKTATGGTFGCTGFLVGPDTVATASHCVHPGTAASAFFVRSSFRLYPGRNGASIPYTCPGGATVGAKGLWSNTSWTSGGGETVDYGAIKTTCPIGNTVGWYGYINTQGVSQNVQPDYTQGYPGDKVFGTQWQANNCAADLTSFVQCRIGATDSRQLFYQNDTFGGQSGSPVYRKAATCNPCAVAIHAYGLHGAGLHAASNHGTRIENNVTSFLNSVKAAP